MGEIREGVKKKKKIFWILPGKWEYLIGEGNGNPLQYSCLENLRDGGAWWAAVYGVAESDTTEVT